MIEFIFMFSLIYVIGYFSLKEKIIQETNLTVKKLIINSKIYILIFILVAILSYGFTITNFAIGIDDEIMDHYFQYKNVLRQGRIGAYLLRIIFDSNQFIPFWRDFIAILILMYAIIIWIAGMIQISFNKINDKAALIFSIGTISCPIIAEGFVFMGITIELGIHWLFVGLSLLFINESFKIQSYQLKNYLWSILFLTLGITFSEASAPLFLMGSLMGMYCCYNFSVEKNYTVMKFLNNIIITCIVIINSVLLNSILTNITIKIYKVEKLSYSSTYIRWNINEFKTQLLNFPKNLISLFNIQYKYFFYIKSFLICILLLLLVSLYLTWKNKKFLNIFLWLAISLASISLIVVTGNIYVPHRTLLTYSLYIGFTLMLLYLCFKNIALKSIVSLLIIIFIFNQTREINKAFYIDYIRYQLDSSTAKNISKDIEKETGQRIPEKPIIFIGVIDKYVELEHGDILGQSILRSDKVYSDNADDRIFGFYKLLGYYYKQATVEQKAKARMDSIVFKMNKWPQENSVKELENYIIVKLGNISIDNDIYTCLGNNLGRQDITIGPIIKDMKIRQSFVGQYSNMEGINMRFATYGRKNRGEITASLYDNNMNIITQQIINVSQLPDSEMYSFSIPTIKDSQGKQYYLEIKSGSFDPNNAITIWRSSIDLYPEGQCYINNEPIDGDLDMQIYYGINE